LRMTGAAKSSWGLSREHSRLKAQDWPTAAGPALSGDVSA